MGKHALVALLAVVLGSPEAAGQDAEKSVKDKQAALTAALKSAKTPAETMVVADALYDLSGEAVKENLYDAALKILDQAQKIAQAAKDAAFTSRAASRIAEVKDIQKEYGKARAALQTLINSPDDAEANLLVGKFLCFHKSEWELGIPNLAKGSDKDLKSAAEKELAVGSSAKSQAEVGHGWWALGEKKGPDQSYLRSRALSWYEKSWDGLEKVDRLVVRDRFRSVLLLKPFKNEKPIVEAPPGWALPKNLARVDDHYAKTGATSMLLSNPSDSGDQNVMQYVPVQAGETYEASVWVLSDGEVRDTLNVFFRLKEGSAEGKMVPLPSDRPFWSRVSFEIKAPDNAVTAGVQVKVAIGPGRAWVDDIMLRKVGTSKNLVDNASFDRK
jgi:hypothetical protein